jgi:bacterioferritin-associated ferredoxin
MIVCVCRGATDSRVTSAIDNGASTLRELQRCGIGDQCGSCHKTLRMMLAAAEIGAPPCPAHAAVQPETAAMPA